MHKIANGVDFQKVFGLFFQIETDLGSTQKSVTARIFHDAERISIRFPDVLFIIIVLRRNHNAIGN